MCGLKASSYHCQHCDMFGVTLGTMYEFCESLGLCGVLLPCSFNKQCFLGTVGGSDD